MFFPATAARIRLLTNQGPDRGQTKAGRSGHRRTCRAGLRAASQLVELVANCCTREPSRSVKTDTDPTLLALFALQQGQLLKVYRQEHAQYLIWRKSIRLFRVNKTVGDFRADETKEHSQSRRCANAEYTWSIGSDR